MRQGAINGWRRWRRFMPLALILAALVMAIALGLHERLNFAWLAEQRDQLVGLVESHFLPTLLIYGLIYAALVAVAFPAPSVLTVFAGFLFGWPLAAALVVVSATMGASVLFLAARTAMGESIRKRLGPRIDALARGFEQDALSFLVALRLAPVLPFWLVTIAPAFFRVKLRTFLVATFFGTMPGTITLAFLGSGLDSVLSEAAGRQETVGLTDFLTPQIVVAFVLLALLAIAAALTRIYLNKRGQALARKN